MTHKSPENNFKMAVAAAAARKTMGLEVSSKRRLGVGPSGAGGKSAAARELAPLPSGAWRGREADRVPACCPGPSPCSPRPMVLPTCPMAEFALPRHSAVMERLRRRIELCRRHHSTCEARYEAVSPERLELERQHTFALHQRCIQAKAKRAGKHRQPPAAPAPPPAAPAPAPAATAQRLDAADGPEHGRPAAVIPAPENASSDADRAAGRLPRDSWI
ncbi:hypothetical protein P7K49_005322 [Saguinus oedipus]|uniref:Neurogenic mastermind-like N-terminal domain-containing protein n=1 Tax=Saguinus oedipus TaxID=9490 RepID=A0ABQ9WAC2_SAGOE|nr:hypothetical protein P7K49_005322 [Saguinus oedipus]